MARSYMVDCVCCGQRGYLAGRGLRKTCYTWHYNHDTLGEWPLTIHPADHVLEIWERYTKRDWSKRQIADYLGMNVDALSQALTRARRRNDSRAIIRDVPNVPRLPHRRRKRAR